MWRTITLGIHQRGVALRGGRPLRALGPGKHRVWGTDPSFEHWYTRQLVFEAAPELREVIPTQWFAEVHVGVRERGLVSRDAKPTAFLRPGTHRVWKVDPGVTIEILSVDTPAPVLTRELQAIVPGR